MPLLKYDHEVHGNTRIFFKTLKSSKHNSILLKDLAELRNANEIVTTARGYGIKASDFNKVNLTQVSKATLIDQIRVSAINEVSSTGDQDCVDISTWFPSRDGLEKFLASDEVKIATDIISGRIGSEGNQAVNFSEEGRVFVDPNLALFAATHLENEDDFREVYGFVIDSQFEAGEKAATKESVGLMDPILREGGASRGLTSAKRTSFNIRNSCYIIKVNDLVMIGFARHEDTEKNLEVHARSPRTQEENLDEQLAIHRKVYGASLEVLRVFQFRYSKNAEELRKILKFLMGNSFFELDGDSELASYRCPDQDSVQLIEEVVTDWFEFTRVREQRRGRKRSVQFYNEETRALFGPSGKGQ